MAKKKEMFSQDQKNQLEAMGIDWQNLDFTKILAAFQLVRQLIALFTQQQGVESHEDGHVTSAFTVLEKQADALQACLDHCAECCEEE